MLEEVRSEAFVEAFVEALAEALAEIEAEAEPSALELGFVDEGDRPSWWVEADRLGGK